MFVRILFAILERNPHPIAAYPRNFAFPRSSPNSSEIKGVNPANRHIAMLVRVAVLPLAALRGGIDAGVLAPAVALGGNDQVNDQAEKRDSEGEQK